MVIVDGGAHIGLAAVFFASKYPNATVIAIEPELSNFSMLLKNIEGYSNIRPIRAGLWGSKANLRIEDSNVETWAFRLMEDSSTQGIPALGIQDILSDFNISQIDILKLDIEGSEIEVLNTHQLWIDSVRTIIIELHDRFRPGCSEALNIALSCYSYDSTVSGENIVITNLKRIAEKPILYDSLMPGSYSRNTA